MFRSKHAFLLLLYFCVSEETRHVIINWSQSSQQQIEKSQKNFPQMRNFHTKAARTNVVITLCTDIAVASNATLISKDDTTMALFNPTILLFIPVGNNSERSVYGIQKAWEKQQQELNVLNFSVFKAQPIYIPTYSFSLNFAYCDWPRWKRENVWTFPVVTGPMDRNCWFYFIILICITSNVLRRKLNCSIIYAAFLTISAVLSTGLSGRAHKHLIIFVLWMLCCMVLVNFYLGELTSRVIAPPDEDIISDVGQLNRRNYKLMFPGINMREYVKSFHVTDLQELIKTSEILEEQNLFTKLGMKVKTAVVFHWPLAIKALTVASPIAKRTGRNCFIGKKLVSNNKVEFIIILPPENEKVGKVFIRFIESGVFKWWLNEFIALSSSDTVRGRNRVVSPTKVVLFSNTYNAQKLTGKVQTIFLLWSICCVGSTVMFLTEVVFKYIKIFFNK